MNTKHRYVSSGLSRKILIILSMVTFANAYAITASDCNSETTITQLQDTFNQNWFNYQQSSTAIINLGGYQLKGTISSLPNYNLTDPKLRLIYHSNSFTNCVYTIENKHIVGDGNDSYLTMSPDLMSSFD